MRVSRYAVSAFIVLALFAVLNSSDRPIPAIEIEIRDAPPLHVFAAGEPFSFALVATQASGSMPGKLAYQWRDFRGAPLGPEIAFTTGAPVRVRSPSEAPQAGYYGLAFIAEPGSTVINGATGLRRELGFAALPRGYAGKTVTPMRSQFGIVHADLRDPYLPAWVKTLTWHTLRPGDWGDAMRARRAAGLQELPLIIGDGWASDDSSPLSESFLDSLEDRVREYIDAAPATRHWELGLEENLQDRFSEPSYFDNLGLKAAAVRAAMRRANPEARLVYQIAGRRIDDISTFLSSDAASQFDILAPHPYAWPHFPTPEKWLAEYIDDIHGAMRRRSLEFPLWFTEFGAPSNDAGVMLMYSGFKPVRALQRADHAAFLVKSHVIALERGVGKIFWYNYRDRDTDVRDPEDHFGLVDHWGFPKPAYASYATMVDCIEGKNFVDTRTAADIIRVYEFAGTRERCLVLWTFPASRRTIALSEIDPSLDHDRHVSAANAVGTPLSPSNSIEVDGYPVFIRIPLDAVSQPEQ